MFHSEQENHFLYSGTSFGEGEFYGVAYVGEPHPDAIASADEWEEFATWQEARDWLNRMQNFYADGLDPDAPDVLDSRK